MSVRETLIAARALIAAGWTQNNYCTDAVAFNDVVTTAAPLPEGVCFCTTGAVGAVLHSWPYTNPDALAALRDQLPEYQRKMDEDPHCVLVRWNDAYGRTQAEVLALFDKAIANARD